MSREKKVVGYTLSRAWFEFVADNQDKIKPAHTALYFYILEVWNVCGHARVFGLPTMAAAAIVGVNEKTFRGVYNDLLNFGFIEEVERSKNQFTATKISVNGSVIFTEATTKAHTEAITTQQQEHYRGNAQSDGRSTGGIIKPLNQEPLTNKPTNHVAHEKEDLKTDEKTAPQVSAPPPLTYVLDIEKAVWTYYGLNEIANMGNIRRVGEFINSLKHQGALNEFEAQFAAYVEFKNKSGERKHGLIAFMGNPENKYQDGGWCADNWQDRLNEYETKNSKGNGKKTRIDYNNAKRNAAGSIIGGS